MAKPGRMTSLLPAALLLFTAAAFTLPGEAAYGLVFYLTVLPAAAWCCPRLRRPDPGFVFVLSLIAWSGFTLFWGEDPGHRSYGFAFATLCTAAFVLALQQSFASAAWIRRWASLLICAGTANAVFSLLIGLPGLMAGARILGWGVTRQPILGGAVMSLAYLTALFRAGEPARAGRRALYGAAALLMAVFVLAMQSRGALLAATGGTLVLFAAGRWRKRACFAVIAACLLWLTLAPAALRAHVMRLLTERGTSHRLEIWRTTWSLIRQKPLLGHGLAANVPLSPTGFPHSLTLSLLFYSGAVGLLLFAGVAAAAARRLLEAPPGLERAWIAALCVSGALAGLTDLGQITKGPGPIWFIIWAPLLLALSLTPRATAAGLPARAMPPPPPDAAKAAPPGSRMPSRG
jgi:O-antigen ligase